MKIDFQTYPKEIKEKRNYFSKIMLNKLASSYRTINLDESYLSFFNLKQYSWRRQNDIDLFN